ncbi:winged helix-turn-helix domain-containing protein [Parabacteroides gordonii]|jgi:hypothetical protein|nr:winged helix-turn-helix domain-containing protein [Parabacteroides gordonii]RGP16549.1 hypothetical protein DXB27_10820 [Parabacteroides gordonii]
MITVLKKANKPLTSSEIADKINDQNLYKRNTLPYQRLLKRNKTF